MHWAVRLGPLGAWLARLHFNQPATTGSFAAYRDHRGPFRKEKRAMQMLEESTEAALDPRQLLTALNAFKRGDVSVRLDTDAGGAAGKVAAAFNEVLELNEQLIGELDRIS